MTTKNIPKPGNVMRQCEFLKSSGDQLARTSGWVMWSLEKGEYFSKLREHCRFHKEMAKFLEEHYSENELIMERARQLPEIEFKDYSGEGIGWRQIVTYALIYLAFPLAYIWLWSAMSYVNNTRHKIHHAGSLYSSIAFLIKAENS